MAVNTNSETSGIPVRFSFNQHSAVCLPASIIDALSGMSLWIDLPATTTDSNTLKASTLQDNITRIDSEGAVYTPGIQIVELTEQSVTLTSDTAPGTPVEVAFEVPGVSDLQTALRNVDWTYEPPEAPVNIGPARLVGQQIRYSVYRVETDDTAPYDEIIVRGSGRLFVIPSPPT